MADPKPSPAEEEGSVWTPANVVTLIRICGVPVFVVLLLSPWPEAFQAFPALEYAKPWIATAFFIILAATDSLDGYLARHRNEVTTMGKFMDPLADKLLVCSALISLVELSILPAWVVLIIIGRDFIISGIRLVAASKGVVIAASWYGKAKTVFQMAAIVCFLLKESLAGLFGAAFGQFFNVFSWIIMGIALVLTIVSLVDYFYHARYLLGISKPAIVEDNPEEADAEELARHEAIHEECMAIAEEIITKASAAGLTIGTTESLTGGLICAFLTSIPGSSSVVKGSLVTYVYEAKEHLAGVSQSQLAETGAVDEAVAAQMAQGGRSQLNVDLCVAVTGIAGPGGAEEGKPVGTVCFALAAADGTHTEKELFDGDRQGVRLQTARHALNMILARLG